MTFSELVCVVFLRIAVIFARHVKAEQGDVSAQYNLGVMYEKGQGVQQD